MNLSSATTFIVCLFLLQLVCLFVDVELAAITNVPTEDESYIVLMAARLYQYANFTGPYVDIISPEPRCETFESSTVVSSVKVTPAKLIVKYYSHPNCRGEEMLKTVGDESNFKKGLNILSAFITNKE
ncbi:7146_t:CDS:1 [Ambispora leptoticha]|uniref:7146_t:CDS:1 n=1 Tax=Ambispora leptoticha TaxID=144679 RepID=A0A9N9AVB7_9GLOM|nr:7146_t:CDS:1 [Ambispora leptoticha]